MYDDMTPDEWMQLHIHPDLRGSHNSALVLIALLPLLVVLIQEVVAWLA